MLWASSRTDGSLGQITCLTSSAIGHLGQSGSYSAACRTAQRICRPNRNCRYHARRTRPCYRNQHRRQFAIETPRKTRMTRNYCYFRGRTSACRERRPSRCGAVYTLHLECRESVTNTTCRAFWCAGNSQYCAD